MKPLVVAILGPTATGKSALALAVAERHGGEIINCDSTAVYRGFDVGTAKPSAEERLRVPHHLLDIADPSQPFTAGDYARLKTLSRERGDLLNYAAQALASVNTA